MIRLLAGVLMLVPTFIQAEEAHMEFTPSWEYVADTVMGGLSQGQATHITIDGRDAVRLSGTVSLDNNGGFVQVAFDVATRGTTFDANPWTGIALEVRGNGETYDLRLRTDQIRRPWQSFRAPFVAPDKWTTVQIPFSDLIAHRTEARFDPSRLRRIGILAIGREMEADIAVSKVGLYR